jgi:hypothetical protein
MKLIFEKSAEERGLSILSPLDVPETEISDKNKRSATLPLPQISEGEISRHYTALAKRAHGVNDGFILSALHDEVQSKAQRRNGRSQGLRRRPSACGGGICSGLSWKCSLFLSNTCARSPAWTA